LEQRRITKLSSGLSVSLTDTGCHRKKQTFRRTLFNKCSDFSRRKMIAPEEKSFRRPFFNNISHFNAGIISPLKGDIKLSFVEESLYPSIFLGDDRGEQE
jgi:hypothetical protein